MGCLSMDFKQGLPHLDYDLVLWLHLIPLTQILFQSSSFRCILEGLICQLDLGPSMKSPAWEVTSTSPLEHPLVTMARGGYSIEL